MSITSPLIKGTLIGALMIGNISSENGLFFEDDTDFHQQPQNLQSGWGWFTLNIANASCTSPDCYGVIGVINDYDMPPPPVDLEPPRKIDLKVRKPLFSKQQLEQVMDFHIKHGEGE